MAEFILKSGSRVLKSGNTILKSTNLIPVAAFDINPAMLDLVDGVLVPSLPDSLGSGLVFRQDDPTRQALFIKNAIDGKPAIRFDGVGTFYESPLAIGVRTIFVVVKSIFPMQTWSSLFAGTVGHLGYWFGEGTSTSPYFYAGDLPAPGFGVDTNLNRLFVNGIRAQPKSAAIMQPYYTMMTMDVADHETYNININIIGAWINKLSATEGHFKGEIARIIGFKNRLTEAHRITKQTELLSEYPSLLA